MMDIDFSARAPMLVLGGSYIGLVFGQMYRRFGSEVSIVQDGPRTISLLRMKTYRQQSPISWRGKVSMFASPRNACASTNEVTMSS